MTDSSTTMEVGEIHNPKLNKEGKSNDSHRPMEPDGSKNAVENVTVIDLLSEDSEKENTGSVGFNKHSTKEENKIKNAETSELNSSFSDCEIIETQDSDLIITIDDDETENVAFPEESNKDHNLKGVTSKKGPLLIATDTNDTRLPIKYLIKEHHVITILTAFGEWDGKLNMDLYNQVNLVKNPMLRYYPIQELYYSIEELRSDDGADKCKVLIVRLPRGWGYGHVKALLFLKTSFDPNLRYVKYMGFQQGKRSTPGYKRDPVTGKKMKKDMIMDDFLLRFASHKECEMVYEELKPLKLFDKDIAPRYDIGYKEARRTKIVSFRIKEIDNSNTPEITEIDNSNTPEITEIDGKIDEFLIEETGGDENSCRVVVVKNLPESNNSPGLCALKELIQKSDCGPGPFKLNCLEEEQNEGICLVLCPSNEVAKLLVDKLHGQVYSDHMLEAELDIGYNYCRSCDRVVEFVAGLREIGVTQEELKRTHSEAIGNDEEPKRTHSEAADNGKEPKRTHSEDIGNGEEPKRSHSEAIDNGEEVKKTHSEAIGNGEKLKRTHSEAIGDDKEPKRTHSEAIGNDEELQRTHSEAIGNDEELQMTHSEAIGNDEEPKETHSEAIGNSEERIHSGDIRNYEELKRSLNKPIDDVEDPHDHTPQKRARFEDPAINPFSIKTCYMPFCEPDLSTYGLREDFLTALGVKTPLTDAIYVNKLHKEVDAAKLYEIFSLAGNIKSLKLMEEIKDTSLNRARIVYDHPVEALQAIKMFDKQLLFNKAMHVKMDKKYLRKPLPFGLQTIGQGLGKDGQPLIGVRTYVEMKRVEETLANMGVLKKVSIPTNPFHVFSYTPNPTISPSQKVQNKPIVPKQSEPKTLFEIRNNTIPDFLNDNADSDPKESLNNISDGRNVELNDALKRQGLVDKDTEFLDLYGIIEVIRENMNKRAVNGKSNDKPPDDVQSTASQNIPNGQSNKENIPFIPEPNVPNREFIIKPNAPIVLPKVPDVNQICPPGRWNWPFKPVAWNQPPSMDQLSPSKDQQLSPMVEQEPSMDQQLSPMVEQEPSMDQQLPFTVQLNTSMIQQQPTTGQSTFEQLPSTVGEHVATVLEQIPVIQRDRSVVQQQPSTARQHLSTVGEKMAALEKHLTTFREPLSMIPQRSTDQQKTPNIQQQRSTAQQRLYKVKQKLSMVQQEPSIMVNKQQVHSGIQNYPQGKPGSEQNVQRIPQNVPKQQGKNNANEDVSDLLLFRNLPPRVTIQALTTKMREIGELIFGEMTGKGRAVLRFKRHADALRCIRLFHRSKVDGQVIDVTFM